MKIGIISDMHIKRTNPRKRLDDYNNAVLNKLEYALHSGINALIQLGDMYDRPDAYSELLMNAVVLAFQTAKNQGIQSYSFPGNHDTFGNDVSVHSLMKTAIYNVFLSEAVTQLNSLHRLDIDNVAIYTLPYHFKDVQEFLKNTKNECDEKHINHAIIVGHHYYEFEFAEDESLNKSMLDMTLGLCNSTYFDIFLGHDHQKYEPVCASNYTIYRPGSLGRVALTSYNLVQKPIMYVYDTITHEVSSIDIPCKDASEIFDVKKYKESKKAKKMFSDIKNELKSFSNTTLSNVSVKDELIRMNTPDECIKYLTVLHDINGLDF